jgi:hypothetical protein
LKASPNIRGGGVVESTAVRLLRRISDAGLLPPDELASHLCIPRPALDAFIAGGVVVPLVVQLTLATLVIEQMPTLTRLGHKLRAQTQATIVYESGATATHQFSSRQSHWI